MNPFHLILLSLLPATTNLSLGEEETGSPEPLTVFVMAGQSNMVGKRCKKNELPEKLQVPHRSAIFFDSDHDRWIPLEPGKTESQGFGPEIAFGARMAEHLGKPIGIIKHSIGGTNLAIQWNPDQSKSLYNQLVRKVVAAQKSREIKIVGMVWVQGGADAKSEQMAKAYADNLMKLIERSRANFGNPEMIFLSGRIPPKDDRKKPHWRLVRSAQQDLEMNGYRWINCDDIEVGADKVHYTAMGMVQLGERQAEAMSEMIRREK